MRRPVDRTTPEKDEAAGSEEQSSASEPKQQRSEQAIAPIERHGPKGPEPTRFGDWESNGRCTDF